MTQYYMGGNLGFWNEHDIYIYVMYRYVLHTKRLVLLLLAALAALLACCARCRCTYRSRL